MVPGSCMFNRAPRPQVPRARALFDQQVWQLDLPAAIGLLPRHALLGGAPAGMMLLPQPAQVAHASSVVQQAGFEAS